MSSELEFIQEGCFYLKLAGASFKEIAEGFEIEVRLAKKLYSKYKESVESGRIEMDEVMRKFWADRRREALGDSRLTLADGKGRFYHTTKRKLEQMDTESLMALLAWSKDYFLRLPAITEKRLKDRTPGYDPIAPLKELRKSIVIIEGILRKRESKI